MEARQEQGQRRNNRINPNVEALLMANNNIIHIMGGQFQLRQTKLLDIVLRLPPLFLMDQILLYDMGLHFFSERDPSEPKVHITYHNASSELQEMLKNGTSVTELEASFLATYTDMFVAMALHHFVSFVACFSLFWLSLLLISLSTRQMVAFYTYLLAFSCVPLSIAANSFTVALVNSKGVSLMQEPEFLFARFLVGSENGVLAEVFVANFLLQCTLGYILSCVLKLHANNNWLKSGDWAFHRLMTIPLLFPASLSLLGGGLAIYQYLTVISILPAAVVTIYLFSKVSGVAARSVMNTLRTKKQFVLNFGLNTFLEAEWVRLRIPSLLRTFWLTRMTQQLFNFIGTRSGDFADQAMPYSDAAARAAVSYMLDVGRELVIRGAETLIALLGMTSIVSKLCHYVGSLFHFLLANSSGNEDEKSVASVSAILFFILALQTGITSLEPEKRFSRICKNLCLLLTALFHFIHNNVSPALLSLTAGHKAASDPKRHLRALSICLFLIVASLSLVAMLWKWFTVGTWLLAVSAFCIEVVVKVIVTVSVYGLFLYDARVREGTWEGLDDAVYYVKAVGNSVEFCFAVFLFFNGGWILFFESGGTIRAVMMVVHAYFNIWCEAQSGWKTFIKRRTAVAKINSLPFATEEELAALDDVCAICYMEMLQAKVTQCRHFFHSVCLRKWLYMQDTCPLCQSVLYGQQNRANHDQQPQEQQPQQPVHAQPEQQQQQPQIDPQEQQQQQQQPMNEDADTSDEDDVVDHDDPPYQAPPILGEEESSSEDDEDLNASSSDDSTRVSQTSSSGDEDDDDDDGDIIFDTLTIDEPDVEQFEHDEEEILLLMEENANIEEIGHPHHDSSGNNDNDAEEAIDR